MQVSAASVGGEFGVEVTVVVSVGMEVAVRGPTADTTGGGQYGGGGSGTSHCSGGRMRGAGDGSSGPCDRGGTGGGVGSGSRWRGGGGGLLEGGIQQTPGLKVGGGRGRGLSVMPRIVGNCGRHAPADGVGVWVTAVRGRGQVGAGRDCTVSLVKIGFWGGVGGWRPGGGKGRRRQEGGG